MSPSRPVINVEKSGSRVVWLNEWTKLSKGNLNPRDAFLYRCTKQYGEREKDKKDTLDFSFSGIKTAMLYYVRNLEKKGKPIPVANPAASFQLKIAQMLDKNPYR